MSTTLDEPSIRDLVARAIDDAKVYARAEIEVCRSVVDDKVAAAKRPAIFLVVAVFLVQAALTTLLVGIGMALGSLVGPALGVVLAAVLGFLIAGLLAWLAVRSFSV